MRSKANSRIQSANWEEKTKRLRKECRRLRAELAQVVAERDIYLKSLYALTREPFSFSEKEIRELEKNPRQLDDVLKELEQEVG